MHRPYYAHGLEEFGRKRRRLRQGANAHQNGTKRSPAATLCTCRRLAVRETEASAEAANVRPLRRHLSTFEVGQLTSVEFDNYFVVTNLQGLGEQSW